MKNTNPKDGIGATKLPLSLVPPTAIAVASLAHFEGSVKYGRWNWRVAGVRASIYLDAASRHLAKWAEGEENDAESGVPHLGHALACINILIDAQACGKLNDDRAPSVEAGAFLAKLTPMVSTIAARHAGKNPRHWSIADTGADEPTWDQPPLARRPGCDACPDCDCMPLVDLNKLDGCYDAYAKGLVERMVAEDKLYAAVTGTNPVMRGEEPIRCAPGCACEVAPDAPAGTVEPGYIVEVEDPREDRVVYSTLPVMPRRNRR